MCRLTSEEIAHLIESSFSEQHSEELSEQPSGLISELPLDELDEVLIKVAEIGMDLQEDSTTLPAEQLSPKPPVFEELARSYSELSTPIDASQGTTATASTGSPVPSVRFSAASKEASLEASRGLVMPRHPTPHPANAQRERERQKRFNAQARQDGHLSRILGVVYFCEMNGAELTEAIKNLSSFANEQQRILLELIAVKGTIAEGSLCQHCQALAWGEQGIWGGLRSTRGGTMLVGIRRTDICLKWQVGAVTSELRQQQFEQSCRSPHRVAAATMTTRPA
jgi:hypothetical protein